MANCPRRMAPEASPKGYGGTRTSICLNIEVSILYWSAPPSEAVGKSQNELSYLVRQAKPSASLHGKLRELRAWSRLATPGPLTASPLDWPYRRGCAATEYADTIHDTTVSTIGCNCKHQVFAERMARSSAASRN